MCSESLRFLRCEIAGVRCERKWGSEIDFHPTNVATQDGITSQWSNTFISIQ